MAASLPVTLDPSYRSSMYIPDTATAKDIVCRIQRLDSVIPEIHLFKTIFCFLQESVVVMWGQQLLLFNYLSAEKLDAQLRSLLTAHARDTQFSALLNELLAPLGNFLQQQSTDMANTIVVLIQKLYESLYENTEPLNVLEYEINEIGREDPEGRFYLLSIRDIIIQAFRGDPEPSIEPRVYLEHEKLLDFIDDTQLSVRWRGFLDGQLVETINQQYINDILRLRANRRACEFVAQLVGGTPVQPDATLMTDATYMRLCARVRTVQQDVVCLDGQYYFTKAFVDGLADRGGSMSETLLQELLDLNAAMTAALEHVVIVQEGRYSGFDRGKYFTVAASYGALVLGPTLARQFGYQELLNDVVGPVGARRFLDAQLRELTVLDNNETLVTLTTTSSYRYIPDSVGLQYLTELCTVHLAVRLVTLVSGVFSYDAAAGRHLVNRAAFNAAVSEVAQLVHALGGRADGLQPIDLAQTVTQCHDAIDAFVAAYNTVVTADLPLDSFFMFDAGCELSQQVIQRNLDREYVDLAINYVGTSYIRYTLHLLLLFVGFIAHPTEQLVQIIEDELDLALQDVEILSNDQVRELVSADAGVERLDPCFSQYFLFEISGTAGVNMRECRLLTKTTQLLTSAVNLSILARCIQTDEVKLFRDVASFSVQNYNHFAGTFTIKYEQVRQLRDAISAYATKQNIVENLTRSLESYLLRQSIASILQLVSSIGDVINHLQLDLDGVFYIFDERGDREIQRQMNINGRQYTLLHTSPELLILRANRELLFFINNFCTEFSLEGLREQFGSQIITPEELVDSVQQYRAQNSPIEQLSHDLLAHTLIADDQYLLLLDNDDIAQFLLLDECMHPVLAGNQIITHFLDNVVPGPRPGQYQYHMDKQLQMSGIHQKIARVHQLEQQFLRELEKPTGVIFVFTDRNSINIGTLEQNLNELTDDMWGPTSFFVKLSYRLLMIANSGNVSRFIQIVCDTENTCVTNFSTIQEDIVRNDCYAQLSDQQIKVFLLNRMIPSADWEKIKRTQAWIPVEFQAASGVCQRDDILGALRKIDYETQSLRTTDLNEYRQCMNQILNWADDTTTVLYCQPNQLSVLNVEHSSSQEFVQFTPSQLFSQAPVILPLSKLNLLHMLAENKNYSDEKIFILENGVFDYKGIFKGLQFNAAEAGDLLRVRFNDSLDDVLFKQLVVNYHNGVFTANTAELAPLAGDDATDAAGFYKWAVERVERCLRPDEIHERSQIYLYDEKKQAYYYGNYKMVLDWLTGATHSFESYTKLQISKDDYAAFMKVLKAQFGNLDDCEGYYQYMREVNWQNCYYGQRENLPETRPGKQILVQVSKTMSIRQFVEAQRAEQRLRVFYHVDESAYRHFMTLNYCFTGYYRLITELSDFVRIEAGGHEYSGANEFEAMAKAFQ